MEPFFLWSAILLSLPFITSTPKTTVILLDNESAHNAVAVSSDAGNVIVDQPYFYTVLTASDKQPSPVTKGDPDAIRQKYAEQLNCLPSKPVSLLFYFESGTSELTESSKNQINELIDLIASREPAAVDIIGHSDRAGEAEQNHQLALERAKTVEKYLQEHNVTLVRSSVTSYGENDPLIPTEDGVAEPQNRRVEVIVR
ncbi:OmpA family protein [Sulfuricurvum sp.]|uniref:OmpA family protein n=1 Tax=Sulfuricurvum sp. TaxID=2025608 RepID=UPI00260DE320|nr:OmpA family protein [Sulfuricurvum sp.]MDD2265685.1 OmpA family protein [Sulfuricurvum sp.]MDD2784027.1 OmpA family protein [Sulfuricurvum sp.]